jgi:hypothetical protein
MNKRYQFSLSILTCLLLVACQPTAVSVPPQVVTVQILVTPTRQVVTVEILATPTRPTLRRTRPPTSIPAPTPTSAPRPTSTTPPLPPQTQPCLHWSDAGRHIGENTCVYGDVTHTHDSGRAFFINFTPDRTAFYAVSFDWFWEDLEGECITIHGTIGTYEDRPQIIIYHLDQLQYCQ